MVVVDRELTAGPARLCQALAITGEMNGFDLVQGPNLFLERAPRIPDRDVVARPRIGIAYATAADPSALWRLYEKGCLHVSKP